LPIDLSGRSVGSGQLQVVNFAEFSVFCNRVGCVNTLINDHFTGMMRGPSGQGGLGWFIFENRNLLDIPAVFAGLLTVIVIGLIVENLIFRTIERNTVQKWGTQS
jgi:hypothetical protein